MKSASRSLKYGLAASMLTLALSLPARAEIAAQQLATGQLVTPTALRGAVQQLLNPGLPDYPKFIAGEAVRSQLSPDGKTLAVLCAGMNSLIKPDGTTDVANSTQYIFLYDVSGPGRERPALKQVIKQTNAHVGLIFSPDGNTLYASSGRDDSVYTYNNVAGTWTLGAVIALGHANIGVGIGVSPNAAGLAISRDGKTLVVANNYNDSISVIDTATGTVRYEHDLRPFFANNEGANGAPGGTFPFAVVVKGNGLAYVSSDRDRQIVAVDISAPTAGRLVKRIPLDGNPLGMTLDPSGARLFVAQDNADQVAVIDTASNAVVAKIDARGPAGLLPGSRDGDDDGDDHPGRRFTGAATFAVTLAPDGRTLYAANAGSNSIAVIPLHGDGAYRVAGLIPTAYEPHDVTFSQDGRTMYIVNGKSVTGANPAHLSSQTAAITYFMYPGGNALASALAKGSNQYQFQLERASLVTAPVPERWELDRLTERVAANNFYTGGITEHDRRTAEFLHRHIKHVIYIVKENRTFDQILGDLTNGANADDSLVQFDKTITPNFHNLATNFVTLDNFTDPGDGSMDGWAWSLQGRVTNTETITQQINYAYVNRGLSYESEGSNRNVPARSRYAADTLVVVTEDDCQDGPDHVDSHRATAYVVGPYVKQGAVVSTHYGQVNVLRTIEDIFGTKHLNLNTAFQPPMSDVFDTHSSGAWTYTAQASTVLAGTALARAAGGLGVKYASGPVVKPKHGAKYWAKVTASFDFSDADRVPPDRFNRVLWRGLKHGKPYPASLLNAPRVAERDGD